MKIPSSKIQIKYTIGGEFVFKKTNKSYQGYYYILNNLFFKGDTYDPQAEELVPKTEANQLLSTNVDTANYSLISNISSKDLQEPKINQLATSYPNPDTFYNEVYSVRPESEVYKVGKLFDTPTYSSLSNTRYFYKKVTSTNPIIIREIDQDTYDILKGNPLYITTFIGPNKTIEIAEKELPGLTLFLNG
jgi:hypothetical protein